MNWMIFLTAIGQGLLILLIGVIYQTYPPKKINQLYGYRTKRTMANQQVWDYANKIGARMIVQTGWIVTAISVVVYWIYPNTYAVLASSVALVAGLITGLFLCERDLDKHFDKSGNPKRKS